MAKKITGTKSRLQFKTVNK